MICKPCRRAAMQPGRVFNWHSLCPGGTWCDCQHKTGKGLVRPVVDASESTSNQQQEAQ